MGKALDFTDIAHRHLDWLHAVKRPDGAIGFDGATTSGLITTRPWPSLLKVGNHLSQSKDLVIARLDLLALSVHRRRITLHQFDRGQRHAPRSFLYKRMERAQSGCVDQDLLRLDAKQEALEQACRIGMGRAPEHTTGRSDQWRALGRIDRFDWCTLLLEQQQVGIGTVGL